MPLYLRLLGRPSVEAAGHSHAWPAERPYRLLALLALRRGWVGRAELAALLWPETTGDRPAANVRKALHLARALPWADALEVQVGTVRWSVATDVHDFELATRAGRTADALGLAAAGDLLDGMDDTANGAWTEWLDGERALHRRRVQTLTRMRLAELIDSPAEAVLLAGRLLDADPLDEDAEVSLLAALGALERGEEQRAAYRSYALRLEDELGLEPSQRVRRLLGDTTPSSSSSRSA